MTEPTRSALPGDEVIVEVRGRLERIDDKTASVRLRNGQLVTAPLGLIVVVERRRTSGDWDLTTS